MSDDACDCDDGPRSGPFCSHWREGACAECAVENFSLAELIEKHPDDSMQARSVKALAVLLWTVKPGETPCAVCSKPAETKRASGPFAGCALCRTCGDAASEETDRKLADRAL